jgi:hypothetical protein
LLPLPGEQGGFDADEPISAAAAASYNAANKLSSESGLIAGDTALIAASRGNLTECVKMLLLRGRSSIAAVNQQSQSECEV